MDWLNNLRIVLKEEKIAYVITEPIPGSQTADAPESVQREYKKCLVDNVRAGLIIHTSMSPKFQKRYKTEDAYSIVHHLREHYNEQATIEGFKVVRLLFGSKMEVGMSPKQYVMQMYDHIKKLDQLGHWMDSELSIDLILARLLDSFAQFVLDYEMVHKIPTIPKLINVLEMAEGKMAKKKGKETTQKETSSKGICFHCGQDCHWKRTPRPTWSRRTRWHVMHHHLQVFMSLRLILFLITTYGYVIQIVAHTYALIFRAQGIVGSSQRESPTFGLVMVKVLRLLPLGLMF